MTKQSRPIRKYLGTENPETGELIPSSGKRGRKKGADTAATAKANKTEPDYRLLYEDARSESAVKDSRIKKLEKENRLLRLCLLRIRGMAAEAAHDSATEEN